MTPGGMRGPTAGLSQQAGRSWGQPDPGSAGEGGSSPDNDETGRHCQTARARQARREGVTRCEPVVEPPQAIAPAPTWRIRAGQQRTPTQRLGGRLRGRCSVRWSGGHEEGLRRTRGEAAGEQLGTTSADWCMVNAGTLSGSPFPLASQAGGGQARCRLLALGGDGAAVVVRGRESRPHGEGRQQVRSVGTGRPGGRR
jgi:hypothetical protein